MKGLTVIFSDIMQLYNTVIYKH